MPNAFAPVAGLFFYPLLSKFDRPNDATLELLSRDTFILARLLFTAGSLIQYAGNASHTPAMACRLLELLMRLKLHEEAAVRRGVLYCLACIFVTVTPTSLLMEIVAERLDDLRAYLMHEAENELNSEVKEMARSVLALLIKRIGEEMNMVMEGETKIFGVN